MRKRVAGAVLFSGGGSSVVLHTISRASLFTLIKIKLIVIYKIKLIVIFAEQLKFAILVPEHTMSPHFPVTQYVKNKYATIKESVVLYKEFLY